MNRLLVLLCLAVIFLMKTAGAQEWSHLMNDPKTNFYDVQKAFYKYWNSKPHDLNKMKKEESEGDEEEDMANYMQFKRWEAYMEPRVYPTGIRVAPQVNIIKINNNSHRNRFNSFKSQNSWTLLGPTAKIPTNSNTGWGGAGRVNAVRFNPINYKTIYCGAPDGGLWKSVNAGLTWSTNTDQLQAIGVSDVEINPSDTNIIYLATGDGDGGLSVHPSCNSVGVLKSTDNGATWDTTGLNTNLNAGLLIYKMVINPSTPSEIYAATNNGIYKSSNSALTWTQTMGGTFFSDIALMPGNPATVYAATDKGAFYLSTDSGITYSQITNGLPSGNGVGRMEIGVTPANSNYVYALVAQSSANDYGFYGLYLSTNGGTSFSTQSTTPNILNSSDNGNGNGGQGWYDLSIAVNPRDASEVVVGGVNIWMSTDEGVDWKIIGDWEGQGAPLEHADVHSLIYLPDSSRLYAGNDGGCFSTSNDGRTWTNLSNGLDISQAYAVGLSALTAKLLVTGWQDNGTNMYNGATWYQVYGGDGLDCFIDWSSDQNVYVEYVDGALLGSTNGGGSFTSITNGITENGGWETPWVQDPKTAATIYAGFVDVWKSTNMGNSWTMLAKFPSGNGNTITALAVAASNPQYIYAANSSQLFQTTNGGTSWTNITTGLPGNAITFIAVKPSNPDSLWVTFSGYDGNRVYFSPDGGSSWSNVSNGLPDIPANCIVYQDNTNDLIYVGTDDGVYYTDASLSSWASYNNGLPNVQVDMLQINYISSQLEAATYGRSIWSVATLNPVQLPPVANFIGNPATVCAGSIVQFTDESISDTTILSRQWSFPGGTPDTSTQKDPVIKYTSAGSYNVTLKVTNIFGSDSITKTGYINVITGGTIPLSEGFQENFFPPTGWINNNPNSYAYVWLQTTSVGGYGKSTQCMYFNNCTVPQSIIGERQQIYTPKLSFPAGPEEKLYFDVAYTPYDNIDSDTLAIYYSTDCGQTFHNIYLKGGLTLCTTGGVTVAGGANIDNNGCFLPLNNNWRTDTVYLPQVEGDSDVLFSFENRSGDGTNMFIDNININGPLPVTTFTANVTEICQGDSVHFTDLSSGYPSQWNWTFAGGSPGSSDVQNPYIAYNTPGTYTVKLISGNINGADSVTRISYITVDTIPKVTLSGKDTVCMGTPTTLTASGGNGYLWSNGFTTNSITVTPLAKFTYSVAVSKGACIKDTSLSVVVNPLPAAAISGKDSLCKGDTIKLTASGGGAYLWSTGATVSVIAVAPDTTSGYRVTVSLNSCLDSAVFTVKVDSCIYLGTENLNTESGNWIIYPNPSGGKFTLMGSAGTNTGMYPPGIAIYTVLGQKVYVSTVNSASTEINLSNFSKGVYTFVLYQNNSIILIKKLIIY